jgi:hypothetical protein
MLNNEHFYHRTIKRNVIAFGTIFKDIELIRYEKDTFNELGRITVPLSYASKETFLSRLYGDPDLKKHVQIILPKMSFKMVGINYDLTRKLSSFNTNFHSIPGTNGSVYKQYAGIPYDLNFELYLYVRNVEDGTQIIEQILPYFNPDYTLSMRFVDDMDIKRDVPIILESIEESITNEGDADTVRLIVWTLSFKMKTYFFGPVNTAKIITKNASNSSNGGAKTNINSFNTSSTDIVEFNLGSGDGIYRIGEVIHTGKQLHGAEATAEVLSFNSTANILRVTNSNGLFAANANVVGTFTGTSRKILNIFPVDSEMVYLRVTPDPSTANVNTDFGYTEELYESPNIP